MEQKTANSPIMLYFEDTPNPESLKFVTNKMLWRGTADFKEEALAEEWSPLAKSLFELPYCKGVYISNNFVTVTKEFNYEWEDLKYKLKELIKTYIEDGGVIIKDGFQEAMDKLEAERGESYDYSESDTEIVKKIKDLIETYVKPAVEMDGGNIAFKHWDKGIVLSLIQI